MSKVPGLKPPHDSLTSVIQDKCSKLNLVTGDPTEGKLTVEETIKAEGIDFPKELEFTIDPKAYVCNSKKAFRNLVNGLPKELPYDDLWNLKPHDPHT